VNLQASEPTENTQSQAGGLGVSPSSTATIIPCAMCGSSGPAESCTECCVTFGGKIVSGTWYCSGKCQQAHTAAHRDTCHTWRAIHRAAGIFQQLFVSFLKANHLDHLEKVSERENLIRVKWKSRLRLELTGQHLLSDYPAEIYPFETTALAVMTDGHCGEILVTIKPLFDTILRRESDSAYPCRLPGLTGRYSPFCVY
jgi:hypothetical protein